MNLNQFFEVLASNASRNYKLDLLKANSDNDVLKETVRLALDPFTNFYIRKIPSYTPNEENPSIDLSTAFDYLSDLYNRDVTGNAGIEHLKWILESLSMDDAKVIERIIKKDLKCGVSIATVNVVWNKLIKEYPTMLCSQYEQKLVDKIKYPAYAQLKMDGMRFNAIVRNGTVEFRTRNGKELDLLDNLIEEFLQLSEGREIVFDGELLVQKDGVLLDRKTGNGILMKAQRNTLSNEEASMIFATVWDAIPYEDFVNEKCNIPYKDRISILINFILLERVRFVEHNVVNSIEETREIFEKYLSENKEGLILKDVNGIWENKRAKHQIKFKGEFECDLKIVGIEMGTPGSKYDGMLGALVCQSSEGTLNVSVGSGFNDEQRKQLLEEELLGKIVAIKYNSRIENKNGETSLFLPIFIELREDKNFADTNDSIK